MVHRARAQYFHLAQPTSDPSQPYPSLPLSPFIALLRSLICRREDALYAVSTAVVLSEFLKMIISTLSLGIEKGGIKALASCLRKTMLNNPADMLRMVNKKYHDVLTPTGLENSACTEYNC